GTRRSRPEFRSRVVIISVRQPPCRDDRCGVMARHARLILPGVALHIYQRGHDRKATFREDSDRLVYLSNLGALCKRWECALHAYCLMTNHVHLMLTPAHGARPGGRHARPRTPLRALFQRAAWPH